MSVIIPSEYISKLDLRHTELAIKKVKDFFERDLAIQLNLTRVSAPLFVTHGSGLNDDLNGTERPVSFDVPGETERCEVVHSLAKWKRYALRQYGFAPGQGLYADMNAIRRDEQRDNLHSLFVDQWDWERIITPQERNEEGLHHMVRRVYRALRHTGRYVDEDYDFGASLLPEDITFIHAEQLCRMYPDLTPKEREYRVCREYGAVFLQGIGGVLSDGKPHDGRAPDYDDWTLNGDILVYYPILDTALELSSMGIRVDQAALQQQLAAAGCPERAQLPFHAALLRGELPLTVGGGIGQSRMCMFFLRKAHVGEVQASLWSDADRAVCAAAGIALL